LIILFAMTCCPRHRSWRQTKRRSSSCRSSDPSSFARQLPGDTPFAHRDRLPVLPWLGIMMAGFATGRWFENRPATKKLFVRLGLGTLALLIALRLSNWYATPALVSAKIPLFTCFPLSTSTNIRLRFSSPSSRLAALPHPGRGRAARQRPPAPSCLWPCALFYFIVHLYLIHASSSSFTPTGFRQPISGSVPSSSVTLPEARPWYRGVYAIWLGAVIALYPLCRWYGRHKVATRKDWLRTSNLAFSS